MMIPVINISSCILVYICSFLSFSGTIKKKKSKKKLDLKKEIETEWHLILHDDEIHTIDEVVDLIEEVRFLILLNLNRSIYLTYIFLPFSCAHFVRV